MDSRFHECGLETWRPETLRRPAPQPWALLFQPPAPLPPPRREPESPRRVMAGPVPPRNAPDEGPGQPRIRPGRPGRRQTADRRRPWPVRRSGRAPARPRPRAVCAERFS